MIHQAVDDAYGVLLARWAREDMWLPDAFKDALRAFIECPHLAISYECRETLLQAIDANAAAEPASANKIIGW